MKSKLVNFKEELIALKKESGTHSPSIATIFEKIPDVKIHVDACFLSNPYATDLFLKYLDRDLIQNKKLRDVLEFYPPQNQDVSRHISKAIGINKQNIFVGNGAIEIIQAVIHRFVQKKLAIIIPTFSSYYEFIREDTQVLYFPLKKDENFNLDINKFLSFVNDNDIDSVVLINPNNPNGGYLTHDELKYLISNLSHIQNIIIDESFIHFAYENIELTQVSCEELVANHNNLIIIKSLSKDFGIAGVRSGYAIMNENKVSTLLSNGYLWNVSGLSDYFFKIYSSPEFISEYEIIRKKYITNTLMFLSDLNTINNIKVYPSKANFALIELFDMSSYDFFLELLVNHGVYVRDCADKIGLEGQFVRIASRTYEENLQIISVLKKVLG
jgi:histidinol-phosphate/aromatic aminotransferase/cobyric acid decarboxylase-like protein